MFAIYCEGHRSHVLLSTNNITAIQKLAEGLKLTFVCICGHKGEWVVEREGEIEVESKPAKVLDGRRRFRRTVTQALTRNGWG